MTAILIAVLGVCYHAASLIALYPGLKWVVLYDLVGLLISLWHLFGHRMGH